MINLYTLGGHTMGDTLIAISLFNSLNQPVHITTSANSWYIRWKRIFDIGNQITITVDPEHPNFTNPPHPRFLESFKLFNRYRLNDHICLFDQNFTIGRRGKKSVAVMINDGKYIKNSEFFSRLEQEPITEYPWTKFHARSTYNFIIDLVQAAGYDPVIIDSLDISVEHKTFILNELCDFVIGYEGGICHLAHALEIPAIILPRRVEDTIHDLLHLDKKTYLIRNVTELLNWSPEYLTNLVDVLHDETGYNNVWLTAPTAPDPGPIVDRYKNASDDKFREQLPWVLQYTDNPTLGGY